MINSFLILALSSIAAISALGARALYRLHRQCRRVETSPRADSGLLRWYAQGFDRPIRIARWLVRSSLLLAVIALLVHAHPAVIVACLALLSLNYVELRFGGQREREHQRAAAFLSTTCRITKA